MALTKLNFYIVTLLIVSLLLGGLITTGQSFLSSSRITLSPDSEAYINIITGQGSSIESITDSNASDIKLRSLIGETGEGEATSSSDYLAVLNFFKNMGSSIANFFKIIYNVPTIILVSLGLDILEFSFVINTITFVLFISLLIVFIKNILK